MTMWGQARGAQRRGKRRQSGRTQGHAHATTLGQLVALGFDVAVFTPAPYRRPRLGRPFVPKGTGGPFLRRASRLDAFSAYPDPAWLPGDAPGGTAGLPEAGPTRSSRTSVRAPQISYAHDR